MVMLIYRAITKFRDLRKFFCAYLSARACSMPSFLLMKVVFAIFILQVLADSFTQNPFV